MFTAVFYYLISIILMLSKYLYLQRKKKFNIVFFLHSLLHNYSFHCWIVSKFLLYKCTEVSVCIWKMLKNSSNRNCLNKFQTRWSHHKDINGFYIIICIYGFKNMYLPYAFGEVLNFEYVIIYRYLFLYLFLYKSNTKDKNSKTF